MKSKIKFTLRVNDIWSRHHWLILAAAVFFSALFEFFELSSEPFFLNDPIHIIELVMQGIILPVMFVTLHRTETQKNDAIRTLSLHDAFTYQLYKAQNWDELIKVVTQLPRNIVPLSGVGLLIYSPNSNKFDVELANVFDTNIQMTYSRSQLHIEDIECCKMENANISGVRVCNCPFQSNNTFQSRYCLPLPNDNSIVGLLHFYPSRSYELMKDQKDFLNSTVPQIVTAINEALLERKSLLQRATYESEKLRFISDLHDTLGQDLAYLRNKMDELNFNQVLKKNYVIKKELQQMSLVVEEANQTVRNMLAATHSKQEAELNVRLLSYAKAISERSKFSIFIESHGRSQILSTYMQFQIFLIFRELLANIEKHARASRVMVTLTWSDELALEILDDGRGFLLDGFDKNEHFGLTIIEMRTRELNGKISIISAPNEGTKVSIQLPINYSPVNLSETLLSMESINYEENAVG
jgi:signal transduction histidine kinase